jgi:hypothetical protein
MKITNIILAIGLSISSGIAMSDYSFVVHNKTKQKMKKILTSEDKKSWGEFDIGSGIKAGESMTLVWSESTNNQECKQYVTAVYFDGSESAPALHDFCDSSLELEFE